MPVALSPGLGHAARLARPWCWRRSLVDLALAASPRRPGGAARAGTARSGWASRCGRGAGATNPGRRRSAGVLRDAWQPSAGPRSRRRQPLDLPAGQRRRVVTRLQPVRRGDRTARHVTVRSRRPARGWPPGSGPAGPRHGPGAAAVPLPQAPAVASWPGCASWTAAPRLRVRGQGTEFDSLRDYVVGDDVRSIDWRATARRQPVVVRTWRPERDRRVVIVLDTSRTSAARVGDAPRLDAAMDAALLLAALASRAGDRVDLLALDRRVRAQVMGAGRPSCCPPWSPRWPRWTPTWWRPTGPPSSPRSAPGSQPAFLVVLLTRARPGRDGGRAAAGAARAHRHAPVLVASVARPARWTDGGRAGRRLRQCTRRPRPRALLERRAVTGRAGPPRGRGGRRTARRAAAPAGRPLPRPEGRRPALSRPRQGPMGHDQGGS